MEIKSLSNTELEQNLLNLVVQEKKLLHLILLHIKEVDSGKLYLEKNRTSLFEYLVVDLGYSSSSAQRRIEGARLIREIPIVSEKIKDGSLKLSQVGEFVRAIKQKEIESKVKVTSKEKLALIESIECKATSETQKILALSLDLNLRPIEIKTVQKDESLHIQMRLSKELSIKLQRCRDLASHQLLKTKSLNDLSDLIEILADSFLSRKGIKIKEEDLKDAEVCSEGSSNTDNTPKIQSDIPKAKSERLKNPVDDFDTNTDINTDTEDANTNINADAAVETGSMSKPAERKSGETKTNKTITPKARKDIRQRYSHCQHMDANTQTQCKSTFLLEVDHKIPKWAGGTNDPDNLTLLCAAHNKAKYRREAGLN